MARGRRIFVTALLLSSAVHVLVADNAPRWWGAPGREIPFAIEAHLTPLATPEQAKVAPSPPVQTNRPRPAPAVPVPMAQPGPVPEPLPPTDVAPPAPDRDPVSLPEPPPRMEPAPKAAEAPAALPVAQPETQPRRDLRPLPGRLVLIYNVRSGGDSGFNLGQATYTWQASGERYSLSSVAEATGLASLFVSGRIEQHSEGRMGTFGLQPEQFSLVRGRKRPDVVRFDWVGKRLILAGGEDQLRDNTQDLLSFPFHLAMTVTEGADSWVLPVTNGRKIRGYHFSIVARETVEAARERLDTLHVQGSRALEGTLDVWLAPDRHWLPVRIRTEDQQGKVVELILARLEG